MDRNEYSEDEVAVVASSCVLPGASNSDQFWKMLIEQKSQIKTISDRRLKKFLMSEKRETVADRIYSALACEISEEDFQLYLDLNSLERGKFSRLDAYLFEAARQLNTIYPLGKRERRTDFLVGCMNPDPGHEVRLINQNLDNYTSTLMAFMGEKYRPQIVQALRENFINLIDEHVEGVDQAFVSSALNKVAQKYSIEGEQLVVDAACASSLISLSLGVRRLRAGLCDVAICGGAESNLRYGAYMVFSKVGALAEKYSLPFDKKTQGLVQGEGCVLFVLKLLKNAVRDKDPIEGVLRGIEGSSDGRSASLFQPTQQGQTLAYKNLYQTHRRLDYLEAHGTGTQVGDQTEWAGIGDFFKGHHLPVGSVKALIGHTKGAAGAAGTLKSLLILKNRLVPGSKYLETPIFDEKDSQPYINKQTLKLPKDSVLSIGVNSFGFGGTNYHLSLEEFDSSKLVRNSHEVKRSKIAVVQTSSLSLENFAKADFLNYKLPFVIPPNSVKAIDKVQLGALVATSEAVLRVGPVWNLLPREKVNVVSACTLSLDQTEELLHRLAYEILDQSVSASPNQDPKFAKRLHDSKKNIVDALYSPINEDAATGILNNVIAGRVANLFDLFGKSYHIDKDVASPGAAWKMINLELQQNPDQLFIFIAVDEESPPGQFKVIRKNVNVHLVTTTKFAEDCELDISNLVEVREAL
jgi:3-oxoacyl-(acyl-carrier-protein) synthase